MTTIAITDEQKEALDGFKNAESESYREVLQRIIDGYNGENQSGFDESQARQIAREVVNDMVLPRALE